MSPLIDFEVNRVETKNSKFAECIPYDTLYEKEPQNKDTMNFNVMTTEEMVKKQNEALIKKIFQE